MSKKHIIYGDDIIKVLGSDYNIISFDFQSLYPNTMQSFNIEPEFLVKFRRERLKKERIEKLNRINNL